MNRIITVLALAVLLGVSSPAQTNQLNPATTGVAPTNSNYSREPLVIQQLRTRVRFENDGTGWREVLGRVLVQSEAGVQALGQLAWGYNSANEDLNVAYVRVRKPDGSEISAGADAVQDLSSPIARTAPMYTDYREKHVTVPALRPNDVLQFSYVTTLRTPLAPGQFWMEHNFNRSSIVLDEQLDIDIPRSRAVKQKSKKLLEPEVKDQGERRVYRWRSKHLVNENAQDASGGTTNVAKEKASPDDDYPDVQLTTFENWDQVGKWYAGLEKDRRAITPEIKAKGTALIAGQTSEIEKVQAIYDFVSKNIRYVSLSFGVGRYQPHTAAEVFANEYGDCKDKNNLLATMLKAAGLESSTVLINSARLIDDQVASPAQFDHVITQVRAGGEVLWLDSTPEVAPFRLLLPNLRDKQALVVAQNGPSALQRTPSEPAVPNWSRLDQDGKISELGKLTMRQRMVLRGDVEVAMRTVFRRVSQTNWHELLQAIASQQGLNGTVSEIKISDPASTREPFSIEFTLTESNYLDWSKKKATLGLPVGKFSLPDAGDSGGGPVKLGERQEEISRVKLQFPPDSSVRIPVSMAVKRGYAEYSSQYTLDGRVLTMERRITVRDKEVPEALRAEFAAFRRAVQADQDQKVLVENYGQSAPKLAENTQVGEINDAAYAAMQQQKYDVAIELYKRVVSAEPKHKYAWNNLGRCYLDSNQLPEAERALRQAIEVNGYDEWAYNNLGLVLWRQHRNREAVEAFQKQIEVNPLDRYAHKNLGQLLLEMNKRTEAIAELEKAASIDSEDRTVQMNLARAYLTSGQQEKAMRIFSSMESALPAPMLNNLAYELAEKHTDLERAQKMSETAVQNTIAALIARPENESARRLLVSSLAMYWDTLGWVLFQRGETEKAERYLKASWTLSQHPAVADHLGQLYEKAGDKNSAAHYYEFALALLGAAPAETKKRLSALIGKETEIQRRVARAREKLAALRTFKLQTQATEEASAEFEIVLANGSNDLEVDYISGSERLKGMADAIRGVRFDFPFPDERPTKLPRRGIVYCSKLLQHQCSLVLMNTDYVAMRVADAPMQPF